MVTRQGWREDDAQQGGPQGGQGWEKDQQDVEQENRLPAVDVPLLFWFGVSAGSSQKRRICA